MNRSEAIRAIQLAEEQVKRNKANRLARTYNTLYDWQKEFNLATLTHSACMLMAANQVGKTRTGTTIDAHHILGDYPDDWNGYKFHKPPVVWLLGFSMEKTRDLLQTPLFGRLIDGKFEGGLIPAERIVSRESAIGTPNAMRTVTVKHATGGTTIVQFWSYSQGQHALMGDKVDWYHIDEEPRDANIFPQLATRTLNGGHRLPDGSNEGGRGILTFTPENGMTQLVCKFMGTNFDGIAEEAANDDYAIDGSYLQTATWDQCPHLSNKQKAAILSLYPAHQREMRSKGVPLQGEGLIYPFAEEDLYCEPFESIPDYWFVINGMDFGWDHPQAQIQLVWDRDADMYYVINAWKAKNKEPFEAWHICKSWATNVPTAWPADGLQTEKGSAKQVMGYYAEAGFSMLPEHATWEDGGNGVWAGIGFITELIKTGRLKVVRTLLPFFDEFRNYHTYRSNGNGGSPGKAEIAKIKDDLLDALRYAIMMRRYAIRVCDLNPEEAYEQQTKQQTGRDKRAGY
jgi:phage terminase large subunit-like protein